MNIFEKIKKLLDEGKAEEADKALSEYMAGQVEGLKKKNDELLADIRKRKDERDELSKRLDALEADKQKLDEDAATKAGDVEKLKAQLEERYGKQIKALTDEKDALNGKLKKHVVEEGLTSALVKAGVAPQYMDAAKALIKTNTEAEIGDNDGLPFAKFDGKAVTDFVADWAKSDNGKHFVSAKNNSGGGSNGTNEGGKASDGKTMTRADFDQLSPAEKSKFSIEGGRLTND